MSVDLSIALRKVISSRFKSSGFSIKSKAPFLIDSTAVSIFPWPEIITTGMSGFSSSTFCRTSMPSIPGILISHKITSKSLVCNSSKALNPSSASSTWYFSNSKMSFKVLRMLRSSSMTNILDMFLFFTENYCPNLAENTFV